MTPIGRFSALGWLKRAEKWTANPPGCHKICPSDGWCDDPRSFHYNRPVQLPIGASAENLWREDGIYDLIGVLDYNLKPRVMGRGSAIFFHLAHRDLRPTAGCIAIKPDDMRRLAPILAKRLIFRVGLDARPQR